MTCTACHAASAASFCDACLALDYHLADCKFYPAVPPLRAEHPLAVMA